MFLYASLLYRSVVGIFQFTLSDIHGLPIIISNALRKYVVSIVVCIWLERHLENRIFV
ncbi:MAG: hypothetical protein OXI01_23260 [Albidovulum sp.]|nr:hypothetical protein [Albidovulum sp.]